MDSTTRAVRALTDPTADILGPVLLPGARPAVPQPLEVEQAMRVVDVLAAAGVPPQPDDDEWLPPLPVSDPGRTLPR